MQAKGNVEGQCTRKVKHLTESSAQAQCANMRKQGSWMHVYKCPHCEGFHVGHVNGLKQRRAWGS